MYERVLLETITLLNGKEKIKKRTVLDVKEQMNSQIKIGHSDFQSKTFMPTIIENGSDDGSVYLDVAGLKDSGGKLFEYVNQFTVRYIFSLAQKVRIVIPITPTQISEAKGKDVRE